MGSQGIQVTIALLGSWLFSLSMLVPSVILYVIQTPVRSICLMVIVGESQLKSFVSALYRDLCKFSVPSGRASPSVLRYAKLNDGAI